MVPYLVLVLTCTSAVSATEIKTRTQSYIMPMGTAPQHNTCLQVHMCMLQQKNSLIPRPPQICYLQCKNRVVFVLQVTEGEYYGVYLQHAQGPPTVKNLIFFLAVNMPNDKTFLTPHY